MDKKNSLRSAKDEFEGQIMSWEDVRHPHMLSMSTDLY